jgi:hypothetical protein
MILICVICDICGFLSGSPHGVHTFGCRTSKSGDGLRRCPRLGFSVVIVE